MHLARRMWSDVKKKKGKRRAYGESVRRVKKGGKVGWLTLSLVILFSCGMQPACRILVAPPLHAPAPLETGIVHVASLFQKKLNSLYIVAFNLFCFMIYLFA